LQETRCLHYKDQPLNVVWGNYLCLFWECYEIYVQLLITVQRFWMLKQLIHIENIMIQRTEDPLAILRNGLQEFCFAWNHFGYLIVFDVPINSFHWLFVETVMVYIFTMPRLKKCYSEHSKPLRKFIESFLVCHVNYWNLQIQYIGVIPIHCFLSHGPFI
jgi:hypothetical protein